MLNITATGTVGNDLTFKTTPNDTPYISFTLITTREWLDFESQVYKTASSYIKIVAYGKLAIEINPYIKKGMVVSIVASRYKTYVYTGRDNKVKGGLELTVDDIHLPERFAKHTLDEGSEEN